MYCEFDNEYEFLVEFFTFVNFVNVFQHEHTIIHVKLYVLVCVNNKWYYMTLTILTKVYYIILYSFKNNNNNNKGFFL